MQENQRLLILRNTKKNIIKYLIRSFIISKGRKIRQRYSDEHKCLYFINPNPSKYRRYKHRKRVVSKYYAESNFIKHDAIRFDVREINGEFYVIFNMIILFTQDGREIITGDSASNLHKRFTKKYTTNDSEKNKVNYWIKFFNFNIRGFFEINDDDFKFSTPVTIKCPVTYEGGEKFDVSLLDFIEDEDVMELGGKPKSKEEKCLSPLTT